MRLKGLPYHCWSQNIILSLANSIGQPIKLDDITTAQRILTYARVLVNIDLSKPRPSAILVDLQGERELEIEVSYENCPYPTCYKVGQSHQAYPFSNQSGHTNQGLVPIDLSIPQTSDPAIPGQHIKTPPSTISPALNQLLNDPLNNPKITNHILDLTSTPSLNALPTNLNPETHKLARLGQASIASPAPPQHQPLTSSSTFAPSQTSLKPPKTLP